MRNRIRSTFLFLSMMAIGSALFANNNEAQNAGRSECTSCHGATTLVLPANQAFSVVDPDTQQAVTRFTPGKTYNLLIRFNNPQGAGPWKNAYVLRVAEISTGQTLRAGTLIDNGSVGMVSDSGPSVPQVNSRIVTSAVKNTVDNLQIQWTAPNSGRVRFQLLRMESNNQNNQNGDRVSLDIEQITLRDASDNSELSPDESEPSTSTGSNGNGLGNSGAAFGTDLAAGCGTIQAHSAAFSLSLLLILLTSLLVLRRRSLTNCVMTRKTISRD